MSLVLLSLLFYRADWEELRSLVVSVDWRLLVGGFFCVVAGVLLSCFKWQAILRVDGIACPLSTLVRYYLIGIFFNNFLPTSIGGDAVRAYYITREYGRPSVGVSSILAERLSGLAILVLLPIFAFFPSSVFVPFSIPGLLVGVLTSLFLVVWLLLMPRVRKFWKPRLPKWIHEEMERISDALIRYLSDIRTLMVVFLCSVIFNGLVVLSSWFVAGALGLNLSMVDLMVVVPLVVLLTLIPFSLNGLGIREGGFIFFLSPLGVSTTEAMAYSLSNYLLMILLSVAGGLLFGFYRSREGYDA